MKPPRKPNKEVRDAVLREFNHRCALCGADRPQVHHIDEDPSNTVESNLLPLCPNHHLTDQHDPTRRIDPLLLALFRKYKDPQMLSSRFEPVFKRLKPLLHPDTNATFEELASYAVDLSAFISRFQLGDYYFSKLSEAIDWGGLPGYTMDQKENVYEEHRRRYLKTLEKNIPRVTELLVEQLRYQNWPKIDA